MFVKTSTTTFSTPDTPTDTTNDRKNYFSRTVVSSNVPEQSHSKLVVEFYTFAPNSLLFPSVKQRSKPYNKLHVRGVIPLTLDNE